MDLNYILVWLVGINCLSLILNTIQDPITNSKGWIPVSLILLTILGGGYFFIPEYIGFVGLGLSFIFLYLPSRGFVQIGHLIANRNFAQTLQLIKVLRWLHPFSNWGEQEKLWQYELAAEEGDIKKAEQLLHELQLSQNEMGRIATIRLFRMRQEWAEAKKWLEQLPPTTLANEPVLMINHLIVLGELGLLPEMVERFEVYKKDFGLYSGNYYYAYLIVCAFTGRRIAIQKILPFLPTHLAKTTTVFWLATADLASGYTQEGREKFLTLTQVKDLLFQPLIQERLTKGLFQAQKLTPELDTVLNQEDKYLNLSLTTNSTISAPKPFVTYGLIAVTAWMFLLEVNRGGSENGQVLYDLGALWPLAVIEDGEWWRLIAANFLHFGWIHLGLNMFILYRQGPIVEFKLGKYLFLPFYLLTGTGATAIITAFTYFNWIEDALYVGASTAIMGLMGGTTAIVLKMWQKKEPQINSKMLMSIGFFIVIQTIFDLVTPRISLLAHWSGFILGLFLIMLLPYHWLNNPKN